MPQCNCNQCHESAIKLALINLHARAFGRGFGLPEATPDFGPEHVLQTAGEMSVGAVEHLTAMQTGVLSQ